MLKMLLNTWISNLDKQIGDTTAEIETRKGENAATVHVREELKALVAYIKDNDLPVPVKNALTRCLEWNPDCRNKK
ncbi:MAG: hypothetical protein PHQ40_15645 [Anaerolineaceae bacterium]|nr:hypothetical protein [Anaerolineaceae bacterium]